MSALPSRRIAPDQAIIPLWVERGYMDRFDGFNTDAQSLAALSGPDGEEFVKAAKEVLKIRRRRGLSCGIGVDLKLVVEFPPGALILFPSATISHSNVPVQPGDERASFTQFTAGGIF
ncbi:hypothetical protein B0H14DRAFT_3479965 [Mycena olivaceomarginata]|nr:hypothetical protein B0H14DRAFT_3479965 [Mycena olivaceomarginata]